MCDPGNYYCTSVFEYLKSSRVFLLRSADQLYFPRCLADILLSFTSSLVRFRLVSAADRVTSYFNSSQVSVDVRDEVQVRLLVTLILRCSI